MKLLTKLLTKFNLLPQETILSKKEKQVYSLMKQGYSNKMIAYKLGNSEQTIKNHVTHIFLKLRVHSRVQAVLKGM